uniref:Transmembrane protein n=1 Tax=Rhizophora mucronata TaxID=61149 RepID=A0A2P2PXE6_RHIMU
MRGEKEGNGNFFCDLVAKREKERIFFFLLYVGTSFSVFLHLVFSETNTSLAIFAEFDGVSVGAVFKML